MPLCFWNDKKHRLIRVSAGLSNVLKCSTFIFYSLAFKCITFKNVSPLHSGFTWCCWTPTLCRSSVASFLSCPCLLCLIAPGVIFLIRASVNHLCTVPLCSNWESQRLCSFHVWGRDDPSSWLQSGQTKINQIKLIRSLAPWLTELIS